MFITTSIFGKLKQNVSPYPFIVQTIPNQMQSMDNLIQRINELQDLCTSSNIDCQLDLPQIVVVGCQSSGKSSVLENIVGRDFLPRGCGMVTRRPLILQLIYSATDQEYGIFNHTDKKFTDFEEIKAEIVKETFKILKNKNDVSPLPITLKLFSKKVLTLTLIDLPGIIRVPTSDQPKNICSRVEDICRQYITNRNAIILAVSPATNDIANSDALQLAKSVDTMFERTIGVLTKVDLMDEGTDCVDVLAGRVIGLRLGFVPIVNRSQRDIEKKKNIENALEDEKLFFDSHPSYKRNKNYCGTKFLMNKLQIILHEHIKQCIPTLQEKISCLLIKNEKELNEIGLNEMSPKETILRIISETSKRFSDILKGNIEYNTSEIVGGARLNYTFNKQFAEFVGNLKALDHVRDEEIRTILYNSTGSKSTILFAQTAFEQLSKNSISILRPYSLKLVNVVFAEMVKIIHQVTNRTLKNHPFLRDIFHQSITKMFKHNSEATYRFVDSFINWNTSHINTRHPDFLTWNEIVSKKNPDITPENKNDTPKEIPVNKGNKKINSSSAFDAQGILKITGDLTAQEHAEIEIIKSLVISYFEIIKKIVVDQVPKAIMTEFVYRSEQMIQETLFKDIYENPTVEKLLEENKDIEDTRKRLKNNISVLRRAYDIMCNLG
ncbi:Vacuolar protein sorting-associated protein 1 [Dictyocoela roeselum]|nr:Vacuolar protein sorting-associated protein 1 [Dictyocoela roeselum]